MIRLSGLSKPFCPMEGRSKPGCWMFFFDNVSLSEFHSLHCPEQHALPYNTNEAVIQYLLASHSEPVRLSFNTNWKTFILAPCFMLLREGMLWCCLLLITRSCVVCYLLSYFTSGREPYPSACMPMHCPTHIMSTSSPLCKKSVGFVFVFFRHDLTLLNIGCTRHSQASLTLLSFARFNFR